MAKYCRAATKFPTTKKLWKTRKTGKETSAEQVKQLTTSKEHFRTVETDFDGEKAFYMAERLFDGEVDLYELDFPAGYFNANSVPQSFFYFEKQGTLSYVNKANLEGFYLDYFGDFYGAIEKPTLLL